MSQGLTQLLDEAIASVEAGESVESCLARYPEHTAELAPLLQITADLRRQAQEALPSEMDAWLHSGRREFEALAASMLPAQPEARRAPRLPRTSPLRLVYTLAAVLLLLFTTSAMNTAAAASLPGETLYQWKLAREAVSLALTSDPAERVQLHIDLAEQRTQEVALLLQQPGVVDADLIVSTALRLTNQVHAALVDAQQAGITEKARLQISKLLTTADTAVAQVDTQTAHQEVALKAFSATIDSLQEELPNVSAALPTATATSGSTRLPTATTPSTAVSSPVVASSQLAVNTPTPVTALPVNPTATPAADQLNDSLQVPPELPTVDSQLPASATSTTEPTTTVSLGAPSSTPRPTLTPSLTPATEQLPTLLEATRTQLPAATSLPVGSPTTTLPPTRTSVPTNVADVPSIVTPIQTREVVQTATVSPVVIALTPTPRPSITASTVPSTTITALPSATAEPTNTPSPTDEPTNTPSPTDEPTSTPSPSATAEPTNTPSPTDEPTSTPSPTDEPSPVVTATDIPLLLPAPTETPEPLPPDERLRTDPVAP